MQSAALALSLQADAGEQKYVTEAWTGNFSGSDSALFRNFHTTYVTSPILWLDVIL